MSTDGLESESEAVLVSPNGRNETRFRPGMRFSRQSDRAGSSSSGLAGFVEIQTDSIGRSVFDRECLCGKLLRDLLFEVRVSLGRVHRDRRYSALAEPVSQRFVSGGPGDGWHSESEGHELPGVESARDRTGKPAD